LNRDLAPATAPAASIRASRVAGDPLAVVPELDLRRRHAGFNQ